MIFLKQSTAVDLPIGPFLDSTDGVTAETALTLTQPDIRLKKNGGAWAQKNAAQTLSHEEAGWYEVALDTTDTNTLGVLYLAVAESGALPVWHEYMVMPANVWDSMFGADKLQVHVDEMTAGIITATVIATDAIDADAIADNAINAAAIATGAITAAKFAAGAIDAAAIANGAIDAATFAAGAIDAAALAADAGTEIGTAVWATTTRALTILDEDSTTMDLDATIRGAVGLAAANLDTQLTAIDDLLDTEVAAIKTVVDAIQAKTDNLPTDPADASVIAGRFDTLDTSVADLPTNAELATSQAAADDATLAAIAALNNLSAAQVNAEVVDALATDTYAEPGQGSPGATIALSAKIGYLYKAFRNKHTQTATEYALYADNETTKDQEAPVSDDGVTFTRGEVVTGA